MQPRVTRGYGILEGLLARLRCRMANALIKDKLRQGKILDIGSGSHPFFLLNTEFFEKYGVDQVFTEDDAKKFIDKKIHLSHFDINENNKLLFPDEYFDVVIMLAVVEHLTSTELDRLLQEIYRVLKKGGNFIFTTPAPWTDKLLKLLAKINLLSAAEIKEHKQYYSFEAMKQDLARAGFSNKKMSSGFFEIFMNTWGEAQK